MAPIRCPGCFTKYQLGSYAVSSSGEQQRGAAALYEYAATSCVIPHFTDICPTTDPDLQPTPTSCTTPQSGEVRIVVLPTIISGSLPIFPHRDAGAPCVSFLQDSFHS